MDFDSGSAREPQDAHEHGAIDTKARLIEIVPGLQRAREVIASATSEFASTISDVVRYGIRASRGHGKQAPDCDIPTLLNKRDELRAKAVGPFTLNDAFSAGIAIGLSGKKLPPDDSDLHRLFHEEVAEICGPDVITGEEKPNEPTT